MSLRQIEDTNSGYELRLPNPKFVLAFLYAKEGDKKRSKAVLEEFMAERSIKNPDLIRKLESVSK